LNPDLNPNWSSYDKKAVCVEQAGKERRVEKVDIFAGKSAIVTGGASGIGRALGEELARRGSMVTLADIDAALLEETVASLSAGGCKVKGATLDVTDFAAVEQLVKDCASEFGRLDYMFNNAGIGVLGEAREYSYEDWRLVIDVNLFGVVHGVASAYPAMIAQGSGHIVNTASLAGLVPVPGLISYTASKYGVVGLSEVLREEGRKYGVKVSVVCPGLVRTPIYRNLKFVGMNDSRSAQKGPVGISVERCASIVLSGVERNKAIIPVTEYTKVLWVMRRISPGLVRATFGRGFMLGVRSKSSAEGRG
jgi:NAD(P)-dependent dehydrogenase (short-subunit alcohol dehydrogenase family)